MAPVWVLVHQRPVNGRIKQLSWFHCSMSVCVVCVVLVRFVSYFCLSHSMAFVHGFMSMVLWHGFSLLACLFLPLDTVLSSIIFSWNVLSTIWHWNSISLTTMSSCLLMGIFGGCLFFTCICRFCIHYVFQWLDFHGFTQFYMSTKQHIMHLHPNNFTKSNELIIHLHCHGWKINEHLNKSGSNFIQVDKTTIIVNEFPYLHLLGPTCIST